MPDGSGVPWLPPPVGWPLAHTPGAKRSSHLPPVTSEPVAMPRKHTPEFQDGPFAFLLTTSKAFPFYCQVLCEFLVKAAGSELSPSQRRRYREEEREKAYVPWGAVREKQWDRTPFRIWKSAGWQRISAVDKSETEIRSISQHLIVSRMHLEAVFDFPI